MSRSLPDRPRPAYAPGPADPQRPTEPSAAPDPPRPPSVERLLAAMRERLDPGVDHDALVVVARSVLDEERRDLVAGRSASTLADLADQALTRIEALTHPETVGVINATGVLIHTNLGRAPWPGAALAAVADGATGYLLLELDRETGRRGPRARTGEDHLVALTGAEDALVTNNNAAALALAVGLVGRGGIVVSRGELVEIGGGVRIPEIVRRAGARLIEVGTTNRTRAIDFEAPLAEGRATAVLRVHPSNFSIHGFTETPNAAALADLAHRHDAIVIDDLGSGALLDTAWYGLAHEPTPAERLAAGSDIVTFSGDKLVGGPQAGLIVGRADLVARMRRDPLARAMRPDKLTAVGVAVTLGLYRAGRATTDIPVWRMISATIDTLRDRAVELLRQLGNPSWIEIVATTSTIGGGSLPGETLPSVGLAIDAPSANDVGRALRLGSPPVIARIDHDRVILDLRTIEPTAHDRLADAIIGAVEGHA